MQTSKNTSVKKRGTLFGKPVPSGTEIYDAIMAGIEPELLTATIKTIDAPYKKETPAERKKRYARYTAAIAKYKKAYAAWLSGLKQAIAAYKRAVATAKEQKVQHEDDTALLALESLIQAS